MIYEKIKEYLNDYLGGDYLLSYANNHDTDWDNILKDAEPKIKYGVLRVDSGTTTQISNETIKVEQLRLIVAIPEAREVFNQAVSNLRTMLQALNDTSVIDAEEQVIAKLYFGEYQDAQSQTISGNRWWIANVTFLANFFNSVVESSDLSITIGGTALKGIISANYLCEKTLDGEVFNGSPVQHNSVNGIRKQLQVNVIYLKNDTMYHNESETGLLDKEEDLTTTYEIVYNNGIKTRTNTMILASVNENVVVGDILKAVLTFTIGA